jgi:hypothetical protein
MGKTVVKRMMIVDWEGIEYPVGEKVRVVKE